MALPALLAPLVGTLIQNGFNILAGAVTAKGKEVIEEKLGVDIDEATLTEEGMQKLRQLELDHEEFLVTSQQESEKLAYADVADARAANVAIQESANASWLGKNIVPILALTVVIGGGVLLYISTEPDLRMAVVGTMTMVLGFYFGTSAGSKSKDAVLADAISRSYK